MKNTGTSLALLIVGLYFLSAYAVTASALTPNTQVLFNEPTVLNLAGTIDDQICPQVCFPDGTCSCDKNGSNSKGGKYKILCSDVITCDDGNSNTVDGCTNTKNGAQCYHLTYGN